MGGRSYLREGGEQLAQDTDGALVAFAELGARRAQVQRGQRLLEHADGHSSTAGTRHRGVHTCQCPLRGQQTSCGAVDY